MDSRLSFIISAVCAMPHSPPMELIIQANAAFMESFISMELRKESPVVISIHDFNPLVMIGIDGKEARSCDPIEKIII